MLYHKAKSLLQQCWFFYLLGFILLFIIKVFYSKADSNALEWILAPTARWVGILTGCSFEKDMQLGYVSHALRFIIAPSCSGVQFMLVLFATFTYSFIHRISTRSKKFCWMGLSIGLAYLFTIFINGLRIILAIYVPAILTAFFTEAIYNGGLTPERLHTLIGTVVYLGSLLFIYRMADSLSRKLTGMPGNNSHTLWGYVSPSFWYFAIVLGLPLLNRIRKADFHGFGEYAAFIIGVYLCLLTACALTHVWSKHRAH